MTVWVLLLRGVNVGGAGRLPMPRLKAVLERLGAEDVVTYIQSGNAVFRAPGPRAALAAAIGEGIEAEAQFRPDVVLLSAEELTAALAANPWPEAEADAKPMHLFFHTGGAVPDPEALDGLRAPDEAWAEAPGVLYLRAPSGIGRSKLAERLPRLLGGPVTARNLRTCAALAGLAKAL